MICLKKEHEDLLAKDAQLRIDLAVAQEQNRALREELAQATANYRQRIEELKQEVADAEEDGNAILRRYFRLTGTYPLAGIDQSDPAISVDPEAAKRSGDDGHRTYSSMRDFTNDMEDRFSKKRREKDRERERTVNEHLENLRKNRENSNANTNAVEAA
jgi:hypothetical protein